MSSILKVDTIQDQSGNNIINENAGTITIGASGDTITLAAGASQSGFGRAGSVNWDTTPKTTGFTAVSGNGYFCDTTSAAFTVTLPATPSAGDIVAIADYNGTAETNNITVGRNSSNINGDAADFTISKNYAAVSFVYVDATAGWRSVDTSNVADVLNPFIVATGGTITCDGDFKVHTFTGPGTFTVTNVGPGSSTVDYLVVAGGGGGGGRHGGGGGAGGFRTNYPSSCAGIPVTAQAYPIIVGGGGTAGTFPAPADPATVNGGQGNPAVFSTITSTGGGGGGTAVSSTPCGATSLAGGSGGGGTHCGPSVAAGNGNTPPVSPPQGNPGGAGMTTSPYDGGGGGGASAAGAAGSSTGNGGAGTANSISGSPTSYAGGGGGGGYGCAGGTGGTGGGGNSGGCSARPGTATAGTVNTGGGGGGFGGNAIPFPLNIGSTGGSGIVIIRYKYQ
jgi:hypothetical protein